MRSIHVLLAAFILTAHHAAAQSFNVDFGSISSPPSPSSAYGGAAGRPGTWNVIHVNVVNPPLFDLSGAATAVTLTRPDLFSIDFAFNNAATAGDVGALMDDGESIGPTVPATWTFSHLAAGDYALYSYAWAPDSFVYRTRVTAAGSPDPAQDVGGSWPGQQQQGVTFALHRFSVPQDGSITVSAVASPLNPVAGTINGFQLVRADTASQTVCAGDGSGAACPCGNSGAAGHGCGSSVNPLGARLDTSGSAVVSADSLALHGSGMPDSSVLYFQGSATLNAGLGVVFGDGLRCAGGVVSRLGARTNAAGASSYPGPGDAAISVQGAVVGGSTYTYQAWYRNAAAFCTSATFNLTNGVEVVWSP